MNECSWKNRSEDARRMTIAGNGNISRRKLIKLSFLGGLSLAPWLYTGVPVRSLKENMDKTGWTKPAEILAGLDIGSEYFRLVVAESFADGFYRVLAAVQVPSEGIRVGSIDDSSMIRSKLRSLFDYAEAIAGVYLRNVYLSTNVDNTQGINVDAQNSFSSFCQRDHLIIHRLPQRGSCWSKSKMSSQSNISHVIVFSKFQAEILKDLIRRVREVCVDVNDIYFTPLASALALCDFPYDSIFVHLGARSTGYVVYQGNLLSCSGCIPVGGDHITDQLAIEMNISRELASQLKCMIQQERVEKFASEQLHAFNTIVQRSLQHLIAALRSRMIENGVDFSSINGSIYLTGGAARFSGIHQHFMD